MTHSPTQMTVAPIHDETKTPTRNTNAKDVIKPSPAPQNENLCIITQHSEEYRQTEISSSPYEQKKEEQERMTIAQYASG